MMLIMVLLAFSATVCTVTTLPASSGSSVYSTVEHRSDGSIISHFCVDEVSKHILIFVDPDKGVDRIPELYFPNNRDRNELAPLPVHVQRRPWPGSHAEQAERAVLFPDFANNVYHWHVDLLYPLWRALEAQTGGIASYGDAQFYGLWAPAPNSKGYTLWSNMLEQRYMQHALELTKPIRTLFTNSENFGEDSQQTTVQSENSHCFGHGVVGLPSSTTQSNTLLTSTSDPDQNQAHCVAVSTNGKDPHRRHLSENLESFQRHLEFYTHAMRMPTLLSLRHRVLIIERKGSRRILNFGDIEPAVRHVLGDKVAVATIDVDSIPLRDQMLEFRRASIVIAMHGAALGWLRASRPHTQVIEFLPYQLPPGAAAVFPNACVDAQCNITQIATGRGHCVYDWARFLNVMADLGDDAVIDISDDAPDENKARMIESLMDNSPNLLTWFAFVYEFLMFADCRVDIGALTTALQSIEREPVVAWQPSN